MRPDDNLAAREQDESGSQGAGLMRTWDVWHVAWVVVLVGGVLLLVVTLLIALYNQENSCFANFASIWGLFVSLFGFTATICTMFETQRVTRKAQREVQEATLAAQEAIQKAASETQEAVKRAQEQIRQVLERVRHSVREADFSTLRMWVRELNTALRQGVWHRALHLAVECPAFAERLSRAEGLEDSERNGLREGADNLRLLVEYIRKNQLKAETPGLAATPRRATAHAKSVQALATVLEQISGRLYHEPMKGGTS
jgi:hypothetical protein